MSLLLPLGLIALISIIALILIYIIKPNYMQKVISSTYVWKLSLKYKKRRIPVNKINNIIIFICQVLILSICAMLIAKPVIPFERAVVTDEKVIIIDASASMMLSDGTETRFDRAVDMVKQEAETVLSDGGLLTVIVASDKAYNLSQRAKESALTEVTESLDGLKTNDNACTYGSADLDGAVELAEKVLAENSEADIVLYTATEYLNKNGIEVIDVSKDGEWNVAVLDCQAKFDDNNHYNISVEVGCFGRTEQITLYCDVYGANDGDEKTVINLSKTEYFDNAENIKTLTFTTDDFLGVPLYSFKQLHLHVEENDSLQEDNNYYVFGGTKEKIKIQYASSIPNNFFAGAIRTIRQSMKTSWDIEFTEVSEGATPASEGFDFYIYEHSMPDILPTDGVVMLVDPNKGPEGSGLRIGETKVINSDSTLATGSAHEITKFVNPSHITIAKYRKVAFDATYEELMYYAGDPVVMVRGEEKTKIVVLALDLNYSNFSAVLDFPIFMYNTFNYFIPSTFSGYAFEIGDTVNFNSRSGALTVSAPDGTKTDLEKLPAPLTLKKPGSYTTSQQSMREGTYIIENFFVKIPKFESNVTKVVDSLPVIEVDQTVEKGYDDLLLYFAIALVALLFVEWLLQAREHF